MTVHIHIGGLVQGVGFRPYVYRLAECMGIKGWVNNDYDGLHIVINAEQQVAENFYQEIIHHPPEHAIITSHSMEEIAPKQFPDFRILHSEYSHQPKMMITPDFGICEACRNELNDPSNPRYHYPFITCTHCGPRYSIISRLPYDRENTAMAPFELCWRCKKEYHQPINRRYYSQTNSCIHCGIPMSVYNADGECICNEYDCVLTIVNEALDHGKIVAVKGIGGYLLMADASNRMTIATLRERKHRPGKPFAVIYPTLQKAEMDVVVAPMEAAQLRGPVAPIVLCPLKENISYTICTDLIAPGLQRIGIMLPYTPLLELISSRFNKPLIATSGNISGSPILYHDEDALEQLAGIADLFLSYDREILLPQDDSVLHYSPVSRQKILIRRSRGLAPNYFPHPFTLEGCWLAAGAELKSSFAILDGEQCYVSQFLGNQEYFDGQIAYKETLAHLLQLLQSKPDFVLADNHPGYMVSLEAGKIAAEMEIPLLTIQHHQAHFAAVLAENNLLETDEPVLGIIWDGTGNGDDGQIWGSECFRFFENRFQRVAHLEYFPSWLGDKMSREPRISAVAISENADLHKDKFTEMQWQYYRKLLRNKPELMTSSMGRFLDGIASILDICHHNTYEGEAAMKLEAVALKCRIATMESYPFLLAPESISAATVEDPQLPLQNGMQIIWKPMIRAILDDILHGKDKTLIAYKVHLTLARMVRGIAIREGIRKIAFSGGVMQNGLLIDLLNLELGHEFELYFHQQLPPNDECISFGQLAYADIQARKSREIPGSAGLPQTAHQPQSSIENHVLSHTW